MKLFIFRNSTIEPYFTPYQAAFSGYGDISVVPGDTDIYLWFYTFPVEFQQNILIQKIAEIKNKLYLIVDKVPSSKSLYIFTLSRLYSFSIETSNHSVKDSIDDYNSRLYELEKKHPNIKILDIQSFTSQYSVEELIDWKYYYLAGISLNPKLSVDFHKWFKNQTDGIQMKRKKCLIFDLDNTLWGGILGEDGLFNIQIGGDYPGNAFLDFQKSILELQKAGVILVVCSKNNESDVLEAWDKNPNILIREEHLTLYKINWRNKAENIREIINQLNIGPESMVYLDDNPSEQELIRQYFPEIEVPEFPDQPYMLPVFIKELTDKYFRIYRLTTEDVDKTIQYRENEIRNSLQKEFTDYSEYLRNLRITIEIYSADRMTIPRIAQLTQKTNQFNLTTKRYSETDIYTLIEKGYLIYAVNVSDRLGNSRITGVMILSVDNVNKSAEIDTFLLSCRILGKDIEIAFINFILNKLKKNGISLIKGSYLKTPKNGQVACFYEKMGFFCDNFGNENGNRKTYNIDISNKTFEIPSYFTIMEHGL
jgi:FkbH-like protein